MKDLIYGKNPNKNLYEFHVSTADMKRIAKSIKSSLHMPAWLNKFAVFSVAVNYFSVGDIILDLQTNWTYACLIKGKRTFTKFSALGLVSVKSTSTFRA